MYTIEYQGIEVEELATYEEMEEQLKTMVEDDQAEDNFEEESYTVYEDGEFYGYDIDIIGVVELEEIEEKFENDFTKSNKYIEMLENGQITEEMVKDVLFSINKKAKEKRDELRVARIHNYSNRTEIANAKFDYYEMKKEIISKFEIVGIHKNTHVSEDYENTMYLAVYDVYGYKAHSPISEEKAKELNLEIENTEFENNSVEKKEIVNDNCINKFMEVWNAR